MKARHVFYGLDNQGAILLAEFIDAPMTKDGLSPFARQIGVHWTTVRRWVLGEVPPSFEHMRRIMEATGERVTPTDFARVNHKARRATK